MPEAAERAEELLITAAAVAPTTAAKLLALLLLLPRALAVIAAVFPTAGTAVAAELAPEREEAEEELDRLDLRLLEDITGGDDDAAAAAAELVDVTGSLQSFEAEEEGLELSLEEEEVVVVEALSATEVVVVVVAVLSPSLCSMSASKSIIRSPMLISHSL